MRQRIIFLLAMLFFLSFSSIVSASGSWECTIFPNMTKTLTEEEAAKAISLYGGTGSLAFKSDQFTQENLVEKLPDNHMTIFTRDLNEGRYYAVGEKFFRTWDYKKGNIGTTYSDKVAHLSKQDGINTPVYPSWYEGFIRDFVARSNPSAGKIMYIDSSSAISEKKKTELFKFAGQQDYLSLLTQMASYAITNGVNVVVCFDEIIQTPSVRTYENDTKVIVVLPIAYGQEGARGAHIKSVNGKITAELFDTSSL